MKRIAVILALTLAPLAHAQDAETRVYGAAQSCTGLRAYLRNYPNGRFIGDAKARIARECPVETPAPGPRPALTKTPTPVARTQPADPCVQARADWANISATRDTPVLRAFLNTVPAACAVQRAQAQVRIDALDGEKRAADAADAAARKRAEWNGVPEFEGTWVLDQAFTTECADFPWRFRPDGNNLKFFRTNDSFDMRVEILAPPTIVRIYSGQTNARMVYENGKIIRSNADTGARQCTLRRQ